VTAKFSEEVKIEIEIPKSLPEVFNKEYERKNAMNASFLLFFIILDENLRKKSTRLYLLRELAIVAWTTWRDASMEYKEAFDKLLVEYEVNDVYIE
jgi:hypothetical protein